MCQKAGPLISGTVRNRVNKGIHLLYVFLHTLRDGPTNTVARSMLQQLIFIVCYLYILELGPMHRICRTIL